MNSAGQTSRELWVCHLGTIPYRDALDMQEHVRALRQAEELPDTLLLLEHPPVYTRGRRSAEGDLPLSEDFLHEHGIEVVDTKRGGKLTYHGPGQLVGYPIMRVDDIQLYLRTMEAAIAAALGDEGIKARSRHEEGSDYTGVWVAERKIASIGVHVSRGVATHGFAVNVENDLEPFAWVVACGLPEVRMTSLARELDTKAEPGDLDAKRAGCLDCFRRRAAHRFSEAHRRRQRLVSPERLGIRAPLAPASNKPSSSRPVAVAA